jgi:hypothetical protein
MWSVKMAPNPSAVLSVGLVLGVVVFVTLRSECCSGAVVGARERKGRGQRELGRKGAHGASRKVRRTRARDRHKHNAPRVIREAAEHHQVC